MNIKQTIIFQSKNKVISGSFSGMAVNPNMTSWGDGDILTKLLGIYEEELNEKIEKAISLSPKRIVNVGCAEGYYAIGMKIRCPNSQVLAIDLSDRALECTLANADSNGICIDVDKKIPSPTSGDFWIIDIEGGEIQLLNEASQWKNVCMLVEMHEWTNRSMCEIFKSKFEKTHTISVINQGSRDPNKFEFIRHFSDQEKWLLMSENRPEMMRWMFLEANEF
jgi:hypothetical protein